MDTNIIIQYTIVGVIILAAVIWIAMKAFKKNRNKNSSCCGCALSDNCATPKKKSSDCCKP